MAFSDEDIQKIADGYQIQTSSHKMGDPNPDAIAFILLSKEILKRNKRGGNEPIEGIDLYKLLSEKLARKFEEQKKISSKAQVEIFTPKTSLNFPGTSRITPSAIGYLKRKDIFGD